MIIRFRDKEYAVTDAHASFGDFLKSIGPMDKGVIAVRVGDRILDLSAPAREGKIEPVYMDSPEGTTILRHSTAHVMAQAVKALYPETKITIGPAIETGFYYDFDYEPGFTEEDLPKIEGKMQEIIDRDLPISRKELKREEAIDFFKKEGESFKVELISGVARRDGEPLHPGRVHRFLPGASPAVHWHDTGIQAPHPRRRLLARG